MSSMGLGTIRILLLVVVRSGVIGSKKRDPGRDGSIFTDTIGETVFPGGARHQTGPGPKTLRKSRAPWFQSYDLALICTRLDALTDPMDGSTFLTSTNGEVIPILCGTFTSVYLYILSFSTLTRKLSIHKRIEAQGPHQYLALSPGRDTLYATSWAWPPSLYAFGIEQDQKDESSLDEAWRLTLDYKGKTPITAISSYIAIHDNHIYSIGGPTGEIHAAPASDDDHGFGNKLQEMLYVPEDKLEGWEKTNKALRYGAHGIEFDSRGRAYVPDLGENCIWIHQSRPDGTLTLVDKHVSSRPRDGPRHAVVGQAGKTVYAVTEHTQFVDVYDITEEGLTYVHSSSLIPEGSNPDDYRGDTIRTSPSTSFVFATTRGKDVSTHGYLCAYAVDSSTGHLTSPFSTPSAVFETPTNGGRANAIEVIEARGRGQGGELEWIVLTDEQEGLVLVISWDGVVFTEVSRVELEKGDGASHAVWLD